MQYLLILSFIFKVFHYNLSSTLQMARTQKNKATALHLGILKARLAKLRRELITPKGGGGATGEGKHLLESLLYTTHDILQKSEKLFNLIMKLIV